MRPVLLFSAIVYLIANTIMFYAVPWGDLSYRKLIYDIIKNRAYVDLKSNVFNHDFKNLVILVEERKNQSKLINVFIADATQSDSPKVITADEGNILPNPKSLKIQLELKNGTIHELSQEHRNYQTIKFEVYNLALSLPNTERLEEEALVDNRGLSLGQLRDQILELKTKGLPTSGLKVEFSKKFSIPFTCLLFGLLGASLGVHSSRAGKSGSFAMCVFVIILYYVGLILTQNMGIIGVLEPYSSVWIPNIILLGITFYIAYKMQKELPFKLTEWTADRIITIYEFFKKIVTELVPQVPRPALQSRKYIRGQKILSKPSIKLRIKK
jgi:lipopolysaccharide export system permease protein